MQNYKEWATCWPQAAADLETLSYSPTPDKLDGAKHSEKRNTQEAQLAIQQHGGILLRNNSGATPSKITAQCPRCGHSFAVRQTPVRYGLGNTSTSVNANLKSSDLIGIMPVTVTPQHVGQTIGQFIAVEVKKGGWSYSGTAHEAAQQNFGSVVQRYGGLFYFSTGGL